MIPRAQGFSQKILQERDARCHAEAEVPRSLSGGKARHQLLPGRDRRRKGAKTTNAERGRKAGGGGSLLSRARDFAQAAVRRVWGAIL